MERVKTVLSGWRFASAATTGKTPSIHWRRPKTFGRKNPLHVDAQADGALGSLFTGISM
jgi:hypothetical protein